MCWSVCALSCLLIFSRDVDDDSQWGWSLSEAATLPSIMHVLSFDFHNTLYQVVTFTVFNLSWVRVRLVVVVQSLNCVLTPCNPMNCSMPSGLPVLHYLPRFAQAHVHWVSDAIWPSHPQLPPSPSVLNLSQHQDLFQWVSPLHQVAKVLELQLQYQSFQWPFRFDFL